MKRIGISETVLSNGLTVLHIQTGPSVLFEASVHFAVGTRHEPEHQNGMTHLLEHMMFRGSGPYATSTDFSKRLESICGETNAFTSAETTEFWFQCAAANHRDGLELLSHFLMSPNFTDFETEKRIIARELDEDYNETGALIETYSLAMAAHFGPHGLGMPIGGTQEGLSAITLQDMNLYRNRWYIPQNAILTIQSAFPSEHIFEVCQSILGTWQGQKRDQDPKATGPSVSTAPLPAQRPTAQAPRRIAVQDSSSQFSLRLSFAIPLEPGNDALITALEIVERILDDGTASRLQSKIREELGFVYSISAQLDEFADALVFGVEATVHPDQVLQTSQEIMTQLRALCAQGPTQEELDHARTRARFDLEKLDERHHEFLERTVTGRFQGRPFEKDAQAQAYDHLSIGDVQRAASRMFRAEHLAIVLVGPGAEQWIGKLPTV